MANNESAAHQDAKDGIARCLSEAGFTTMVEYAPRVHEFEPATFRRRVDVALPMERIAIEIWTNPAVSRSLISKSRAAELARHGWYVINVSAQNWTPEGVLKEVNGTIAEHRAVREQVTTLEVTAATIRAHLQNLISQAHDVSLYVGNLDMQIANLRQLLGTLYVAASRRDEKEGAASRCNQCDSTSTT